MVLMVVYILCLCAVSLNLLVQYKRNLMMMQQNSYRIDRYRRWLKASADTTSMRSLLGLLVALGACARFVHDEPGMVMMGVFGVGSLWYLLGRHYKKPLVWTMRCRRIYAVMLLVSAAVVCAVVLPGWGVDSVAMTMYAVAAVMMLLFVSSHVVIMLSVWLLGPVEGAINRRYRNEAAAILRSMPRLKVIGVTGSYGKTSTKHYLERILSEHYSVLMTPGSYNTTLGVIRTVRELMKPYHEVFICEMGAKQPGDVADICDLVHPQIGVVTAVGPQHLESFKTIECVQQTKFELVDALPADGLAVINDDFEYVASRTVDNVAAVRYAVKHTGAAGFVATEIRYTSGGTRFKVRGGDVELELETRLVGECNVSNLIAAVVVALHMGVPEHKIVYAVSRIEQVEHRLSVKRTPGGITVIDDAFNSNPTGSAMALDVLAALDGGRRFVITPGMIELGDEQYELNRRFGERIARCADVAIVVGDYNRDAIVGGIESVKDSAVKVHAVKTFAQAQQYMLSMACCGDVVLYENDLPDTFK